MKDFESEIKQKRNEIDEIDDSILKLLLKRKKISKEIQKIKLKNKLPLIDSRRELEIVNNLKIKFQDIPQKTIKKFYAEILSFMKS